MPSLSESAFLANVPVSLVLTYNPVPVSTPSFSPSPSVSELSGLVLSSYSSKFVSPSSSSSASGSSTPYFSSQESGSPSSSISSWEAPIGLAPSANERIVPSGRTSVQIATSSRYPLNCSVPLLRAPNKKVPPPLGARCPLGPPSI